MAISKKLRFEVFKRDLFTCQYCGRRPPDVVLEVDHVTPRRDGGPDEIDNLTTSCYECNRGKAANQLGTVAPAVDELVRLAAIQEMAERSRILIQERAAAERQEATTKEVIETVFGWWIDELGDGFAGAFQDPSVRLFMRKGLTPADLRVAIEATAARRAYDRMSADSAWRYFCGACWGKIRDRGGDG